MDGSYDSMAYIDVPSAEAQVTD